MKNSDLNAANSQGRAAAGRSGEARLPDWLKAVGKRHKSVAQLAANGFGCLIEAALISGAGRKRRDSYTTHFFPQGLERRLGGLWERSQIDLRSVAGSSKDYIEALEAGIGGALDDFMRTLPLLEHQQYFRLMVLVRLAVRRALTSTSQTKRKADREWLEIAWERILQASTSDRHRECSLAAERWISPFETIRIAAGLLHKRRADCRLADLDIGALALVGAAAHSFSAIRRCALCFRWTLPGHAACARHCLSEEVRETDPERQARYAHGRRLAARIGRDSAAAKQTQYIELGELRYVIARLLWKTPVPGEDKLAKSLLRKIRECSAVVRALGEQPNGLRASQVVDELRRHIDPFEYRIGAWHHYFETIADWLQLEECTVYLRRGPSAQTSRKIREALSLAECKGYSRAQIAEALGVHPTTISQWCRRRKDDSSAQRLQRALSNIRKDRAQKRGIQLAEALGSGSEILQ